MNKIISFIEKHKKFLKKVILFTIYVIVICIINSDSVTSFFNTIFGEYITAGIKIVTPFTLIASEV